MNPTQPRPPAIDEELGRLFQLASAARASVKAGDDETSERHVEKATDAEVQACEEGEVRSRLRYREHGCGAINHN